MHNRLIMAMFSLMIMSNMTSTVMATSKEKTKTHSDLYDIVKDQNKIKDEIQKLELVTAHTITLMEEKVKVDSHDSTEVGYDKKIIGLLHEKLSMVKQESSILKTL